MYLNIVLSWPEDGWLRPKHGDKYNLIVIIASFLDACCVLTVHNILYKVRRKNLQPSVALSTIDYTRCITESNQSFRD